MFTPSTVDKNFFVDSVPSQNRGKTLSLKSMYGSASKAFIGDASIHDANFAFLTTSLA